MPTSGCNCVANEFLVVSHDPIRGCVRWSVSLPVGPSLGPSVGRSVQNLFLAGRNGDGKRLMPRIRPCFCNYLVKCPVVTEMMKSLDRIGVEQLFAHSLCLLYEGILCTFDSYCSILRSCVLPCAPPQMFFLTVHLRIKNCLNASSSIVLRLCESSLLIGQSTIDAHTLLCKL